MTFGGLLGALRRRWYVVVVGLLATAGLAWGVSAITPPEYTARGLILLLPSVPEDAEGSNPFLALGGLDLPARVLVASYSSNSAQAAIEEQSADAEVVVSIEESTRGPIIAVDVADTSAEGTLDTLAFVSDSIPATLATLQSDVGVPLNSVVRSMPLTMDTEAEPSYETVTRLLVLACAAGLALTAGAAYAMDGILKRRVRRRSSRNLAGIIEDDPIYEDASSPDTDGLEILRGNVPASPQPALKSRETGMSPPRRDPF